MLKNFTGLLMRVLLAQVNRVKLFSGLLSQVNILFGLSMIRAGEMDARYMLRPKIDNLAGKVINLIEAGVINPAKQANLL